MMGSFSDWSIIPRAPRDMKLARNEAIVPRENKNKIAPAQNSTADSLAASLMAFFQFFRERIPNKWSSAFEIRPF